MFGDRNPYEMEGPVSNPALRHVTVHTHSADYNDDEDPIPPMVVTYGPADCPEAIVNAVYQKLYPSPSDEEAYSNAAYHAIRIGTDDTMLWRDDLACRVCLERRLPFLNGICRCGIRARPLYAYDLQPGAIVRCIVDLQ